MKDFEIVKEVKPRIRNTAEIAEGFTRPVGYVRNPDIIDELKNLAEQSGGLLKPQTVVEAAVPEDSPLHKMFEWDDSAAAERYRLVQARALITISVEYLPVGRKVKPQKVFVSLSSDRTHEGGGYRTLVSVLSDKDKRQELIQDALKDMSHFEERYKSLKEVQAVIETMHETKKQIA